MQRISFSRALAYQVAAMGFLCCLVSGATLESPESGFLQKKQYPTLDGDVVVNDMDAFADWLYDENGDKYDSDDAFRLYRVNSEATAGGRVVLDEDDRPALLTSFIEVNSEQNPLSRDIDDLPESPNDIGRDHRKGDLQWVLVSSFLPGQDGTGKVWAVPVDRDDRNSAFVLIGGLQEPKGVCFDPNHDFLYVCDPKLSVIYQYEIDWDDDDKFVLKSDLVATIMENVTASDCSVDAYGNLYYVDSASNSISTVGYLDLWAGYVGQARTLYQSEGKAPMVSSPVAIDVYNSDTIYFVNNENTGTAGLLDSADAASPHVNEGNMQVEVREEKTSWGLAVSDKFAYFSSDDGSVWLYRIKGSANLFLKSAGFFSDPRGLCYGDDKVFVADADIGEVFYFEDSRKEEEDPKGFIRLEGAYGLECING